MSGAAPKPPQPPVNDPPITSDNQHSQAWTAFFQDLSGRLGQIMGTGVIMQTGTSTSDGGGGISVTLPMPFGVRTLSFAVDGSPGVPQAVYVPIDPVLPLPLDVITGVLGQDSGGGVILPVPNADFTWYATGI
jgi:hypothetical protein